MVHAWNLVILTSFIIATTIELVLFVKPSVENFIITKDYAETATKNLHPIG